MPASQAFVTLVTKAGVGSIGYKSSYICKNQTNKKKSPHAYTYQDFSLLENSAPRKVGNLRISKNPHTRTHTRIFACWKIQKTEITKI